MVPGGEHSLLRIGISALPLEKKGPHDNAGVGRYVRQIVDHLILLPTEHEFVVFVGERFETPPDWAAHPRLKIEKVSSKVRRVRSLWNLFSAIPLAKRHNLDVWFGPNLAVPLWSKAKRLLVVHDLFPITNPEWFTRANAFMFGTALKISTRRSDRIITVSEFTKSEVIRVLGIPGSKIDVALNGPGNTIQARDPSTVKLEDLERIGVPFRRFYFGLGTVEPRKNLTRVFAAVHQLADRMRSEGIGLVVSGPKGWKESALATQIENLGIGDLIHFTGYVADDDLATLFAACEAMVFPSLGEGFGLPVLEAHLYGAIPICSREGGVREVAGPGAIFVDVLDSKSIAAGMLEALSLPDRAERIENGKAHAQTFTWVNSATETLASMERMVGRRK